MKERQPNLSDLSGLLVLRLLVPWDRPDLGYRYCRLVLLGRPCQSDPSDPFLLDLLAPLLPLFLSVRSRQRRDRSVLQHPLSL